MRAGTRIFLAALVVGSAAAGLGIRALAQGHDEAPAAPPTSAGAQPAVAPQPVWNTFHGQLNAQKYSPVTQITTSNVGKLKLAWQYHTGDVSDGSGDRPATVWSATPIFANDTLYLGTPFYRIVALDPGTGQVKWDDAFAALAAIQYDGWLTIEAFSRNDPGFANAIGVWREFNEQWDIAENGYKFIREMGLKHGL